MDLERMCLNSAIQFADFEVSVLNAERNECEKVKNVANKMLKFQWFIPLIMISAGFLVGGLTDVYNFLSNALYGSLCGLIGTIPTVSISFLFWGIIKNRYNKKINNINDDINVALKFKNCAEEEIEKLNERKKESSSEKNSTVSISEYHKIIDDMAEKENKEEKKSKRLILKKK